MFVYKKKTKMTTPAHLLQYVYFPVRESFTNYDWFVIKFGFSVECDTLNYNFEGIIMICTVLVTPQFHIQNFEEQMAGGQVF